MKLKVLTIFILIILASATEKSRIRKLTESNLEAFSKDNSYWLIQISGTTFSIQRDDALRASNKKQN